MKNLLACLVVFAAFSAGAQSTMPWNPDANDDSYIGATDMLSTLAVYGQQFGIDSSLTCDYDGTPIEEFWGNVWNGDIIIDSMLVQYHTIDSAEVYVAGCPDPIWESVSYERAWVTDEFLDQPSIDRKDWYIITNGFQRKFILRYYASNGAFHFNIVDTEISQLGLDEILGSHSSYALNNGNISTWQIPFSIEEAAFDANGVQFDHWGNFLEGATYVNILPYWHYAE